MMGETRNAYRIVMAKPLGKQLLGGLRGRYKDMLQKQIVRMGSGWIWLRSLSKGLSWSSGF
jgi:hypothetical protein